MALDSTIRLSDILVAGTILVAAVKLILGNRDILKNLIRTQDEHTTKLAALSGIIDEHDDIIIRNGLDLRADRNLTRRHKRGAVGGVE